MEGNSPSDSNDKNVSQLTWGARHLTTECLNKAQFFTVGQGGPQKKAVVLPKRIKSAAGNWASMGEKSRLPRKKKILLKFKEKNQAGMI